MGSVRRIAAALTAATTLALMFAVPVNAALVATGAAKVKQVSKGAEHVLHAEMAMSKDGTRATAVWTVRVTPDGGGTTFTLKAASATVGAAGATWGAATTLVSDSPSDISPLGIDISDDGSRVLVAWSRDRDGASTYIIEARAAAISGTSPVQTWSPLTEMATDDEDHQHPVVALNAAGTRGLIAWRHVEAGAWSVEVATVSSVGAAPAWGTPVSLFSSTVTDPGYDYIRDLTVGLSDAGTTATLGWIRSWADGDDRVQAISGTVSTNSSSWGSIATLASGEALSGFDLDLAATGTRATAVWSTLIDGDEQVLAASADVSGTTATWGTAAVASDAASSSGNPQVEVSSDGSRAFATWLTRDDEGTFITNDQPYFRAEGRAATISSRAATWGDTEFLTEEEVPVLTPRLRIADDGGSAVVAWMNYNPSGFTPVLKPYISAVTVSGTTISPVNSRAIAKKGVPSATDLILGLSADATRAVTGWIVDVDNGYGDPDVMQIGVMTFEAQLDPTIDSVTPAKGPVTGGTEVTITGSNFIDVEDVSFGFDSADDFTVVSDSEILATAPVGERLGKVSITITTAAGEVTRKNAFDYIKGPLPKITKLSPAVGGLTVEDEITITGANLVNPEVTIGGKEADMVEFISSSEIIVRVPVATRLGAVDVTITTLSGSVTRADGFTYVVVPAKPSGLSIEPKGDGLALRWNRLRSSQTAIEVTCTSKADGTEVTARVGKDSTTASLADVDAGSYTCVVQGVGRGGAMGLPSQSRRLTVQ